MRKIPEKEKEKGQTKKIVQLKKGKGSGGRGVGGPLSITGTWEGAKGVCSPLEGAS